MSAGFNGNIQYGGTSGSGSHGCPGGYVAVGTLCFKFPIQTASRFITMANTCKGLASIPYAPTGMVQNAVVKGLIKTMVT